MIDMRMRQHDGVDALRGNGQSKIFLPAFITSTLKETAVEQHRASANAQDVARPGDLARGAEELDLHRRLLIDAARSLKHDRQATGILRHQRWLPAASTALVQQIRERILVIACVTRQVNDDGLVFFHSREISSFPAMDTTPGYPTLRIVSHPLIQHKLTILRDRGTPTKIFKELVDEIAMLMAYEATNDLVLEPTPVDTPLESTVGQRVSGKKLTLVPILRAGLGMVEGIYRLVPGARVGHIGLYRNHDTLEPVDYYFKVPGDAAERDFFLLDPMLATGGSAVAAVSSLKRAGATRIRFLCLVAAPEGVRRLAQGHPDVMVYCAALDRALNEQGYIMPGLGDAGDRLFGTR
jgi:uracil phosphoribosyltransferase